MVFVILVIFPNLINLSKSTPAKLPTIANKDCKKKLNDDVISEETYNKAI